MLIRETRQVCKICPFIPYADLLFCQCVCRLALYDSSWSMHIFAIRYTSRRTHSWRKPGQVGILTHREAKWIILILLEGSALHRVIVQHTALSLTLPHYYGRIPVRGWFTAQKQRSRIARLTSSAETINKSTALWGLRLTWCEVMLLTW